MIDPVAVSSRRSGERFWRALRAAVSAAVVVDDAPLRLLAIALLTHGHALVEDVPGVGKTLLTRAFARALGLDFGRIQGTPDLLPSDVLGASILEGTRFRFIAGPVFTNVLLVDEINRATPRTQSALLEAMQEGQVSIEGETRPLPNPFMVLATQNPIELEGTFSLPEAQLDRFLVRVSLGYPSVQDEHRIASRYRDSAEPLEGVERVVEEAAIPAMRDLVRGIQVAEPVADYAIALVRASRGHPDLRLGASPRASVALYRATQAAAFLDGREFALPDDVKAVAPAVLGHRVLLDLDRQLRGATAEQVIAELLDSAEAPPHIDHRDGRTASSP